MVHSLVDRFPFHHRAWKEMVSWYNGIYLVSFGPDKLSINKWKRKLPLVTDTDFESESDEDEQ